MHLAIQCCMCTIVRGVHHVLGCLYLAKLFHKQNASESHTYNLKAVYKTSTGRKFYEFYVQMSPNCSILASIFHNFPGGGMPPDPPSSSMQSMLRSVLCTPLPKSLVP